MFRGRGKLAWVFVSVAGVVSLMSMPVSASVVDTIVDTTVTGATVNGNVAGGEYIGVVSGGGGGFGGPVGTGMLSVDSDLNGIQLGFSNMGDITFNSIRVYFDVAAGGFANNAGCNDTQDFGRERLCKVGNPLTYPFPADYGWIISPAFGGFQALFQLQDGGPGSLNFSGFGVIADPIGEFPSNSTYEFHIPYADLGIAAGATVDFAVVYANNDVPAYVSNEGFPFPGNGMADGGGNWGNGAVTFTNFHRLVTIPEPASLFLLGLVGLALRRRGR